MDAEPGDEITVTVKGRYQPGGTAHVSFSKETGDAYDFAYAIIDPFGPRVSPGLDWNVPLAGDAALSFKVTSQYRNGVHIDLDDGAYWLRRPDGWHRMYVMGDDEPLRGRGKPREPQRLCEAGGKSTGASA